MLRNQAAKTVQLEKELESERQSNKELGKQLTAVMDFVKKEEKRKIHLAITAARKRIKPIRFILRFMVVAINFIVFAAFIIPSLLCMEVKWVNIATVGGTFIAVEGLLNGYLIKRVPRRKKWLMKRYKKVLEEEMRKQGLSEA